ncbi:MAG: glycosyltransferase family 39 protein [Candidatus Omnitrophota bacterium]
MSNVKRISIYWILVALLIGALAAQCSYAAWIHGQTTDETYYNGSGYPMVRYNDYKFLGEHPPFIIQLGSLPLLFLHPEFPIQNFIRLPESTSVDISKTGALFLYKMGNDPGLILLLERIPIVLLTVLLGIGVFCFAGELFGMWGALLSLGLFAFDPNMLAHGSLYTTDMGITVFYFFSFYALKRFFDQPSAGRAVLLGIVCGLTFMSKISGLILLPAISSLFLVYYFSGVNPALIKAPSSSFEKWILGISLFLIANAIGERQAMVLFGPFCLFAFYLCARDVEKIRNSRVLRIVLKVTALAGAVLCIVYSMRLKKKYGVSVASFLTIGNLVALGLAVFLARFSAKDVRMRILKFFLAIWVLAALVIVLGYTDFIYKFYQFAGFGNFIKPLGIVLNHSKDGHGICVEGSFIACNWCYFPGVLAVKTPLLTLVLMVLGAIGLFFSKRSVLIKSLVFLPLVFFLGAAMQNKIYIGLRHILPIYPFLFLLAGYTGSLIGQITTKPVKHFLAVVLAVLFVFSAVRTVLAGSDYLAYFNEWIGSPEQGSKLVADSNLNWGQDNKRLAEFVLERKLPSIIIASEAENADIYEYYKIPWKRLETNDLINPAPGFYALGIGYYMAQQNNFKSWFYGRRPLYRVGKTFYVFKVPSQGQLH